MGLGGPEAALHEDMRVWGSRCAGSSWNGTKLPGPEGQGRGIEAQLKEAAGSSIGWAHVRRTSWLASQVALPSPVGPSLALRPPGVGKTSSFKARMGLPDGRGEIPLKRVLQLPARRRSLRLYYSLLSAPAVCSNGRHIASSLDMYSSSEYLPPTFRE